jgi:hypothetical protein
LPVASSRHELIETLFPRREAPRRTRLHALELAALEPVVRKARTTHPLIGMTALSLWAVADVFRLRVAIGRQPSPYATIQE